MDSGNAFEVLSELNRELHLARGREGVSDAVGQALARGFDEALVCLEGVRGPKGRSSHPLCQDCPGFRANALEACVLWSSPEHHILPLQGHRGLLGLIAVSSNGELRARGGCEAEKLLSLIAQQANMALERVEGLRASSVSSAVRRSREDTERGANEHLPFDCTVLEERRISSVSLRSVRQLVGTNDEAGSFAEQTKSLLTSAVKAMGCRAGFLCWCGANARPALTHADDGTAFMFRADAFRGLSEMALRAGCTVFENHVAECEGLHRASGAAAFDNVLLAPVNVRQMRGQGLLGWLGKPTPFSNGDADLAADLGRLMGYVWQSWSEREFSEMRARVLGADWGPAYWMYSGSDFVYVSEQSRRLLGYDLAPLEESAASFSMRALRRRVDPAQRHLFDSVLGTVAEDFRIRLRLRSVNWEEAEEGAHEWWLTMVGHHHDSPFEHPAFVGHFE